MDTWPTTGPFHPISFAMMFVYCLLYKLWITKNHLVWCCGWSGVKSCMPKVGFTPRPFRHVRPKLRCSQQLRARAASGCSALKVQVGVPILWEHFQNTPFSVIRWPPLINSRPWPKYCDHWPKPYGHWTKYRDRCSSAAEVQLFARNLTLWWFTRILPQQVRTILPFYGVVHGGHDASHKEINASR